MLVCMFDTDPRLARRDVVQDGAVGVALCLFFTFCFIPEPCGLIRYDRTELLHIRASMPASQPAVMDLPPNLSRGRLKHRPRKRGKRGGVLVRLRHRGHRLPLPSLVLSNVRSLANKTDELTSLIVSQRDFRDCAAICLTGTWLTANIPDAALQQGGFTFHRADRTRDSQKQRGGGVGFSINQNWCTDTKTLSSGCSSDLEHLMVRCIPFYSPREVSSIILCAAYIPPSAAAASAAQQLADHVLTAENSYPDSVVLVLGDFNHVSMRKTLPRYKPQVHISTRLDKTLDQWYSSIPEAYQAQVRAPIGKDTQTPPEQRQDS
ncbi:uncharacterized protein LOC129181302 [Dunckerocampus dactyliophorus]|uniref:uncharacterized protein LOC129181302 n=1 Tax=Dunckerocampus dactyliophorus TaxID=161453 RepID=UPI0024055A3C|nr:uncharacterized protein LOC129181302 [Dunckerocampus dactyliophorus]